MAEKVLNSTLSGEEIVQAVGYKVMEALRRDCLLSPHTSYDYFSGKILLQLTMNDAGLREVEVNHSVAYILGVGPGKLPEADESVEHSFLLDPQPPNELRVETEQPVPVLTKDETGRKVIKPVTYSRRKLPRPTQ